MTIEDMQSKMTVFYRKENGAIKQIVGGIQDMNVFGDEQTDYIKIWDYIVIDRDNYIISKPNDFIVDLDTKQLKIKQDAVPKYPVA